MDRGFKDQDRQDRYEVHPLRKNIMHQALRMPCAVCGAAPVPGEGAAISPESSEAEAAGFKGGKVPIFRLCKDHYERFISCTEEERTFFLSRIKYRGIQRQPD